MVMTPHDVKWPANLDPPSWILQFSLQSKKKGGGINSKLSQNADEMQKMVNFMKQIGRNYRIKSNSLFLVHF